MSVFELPSWIEQWFQHTGQKMVGNKATPADFMAMVLALARENFEHPVDQKQRGGPFAAAVVHKPSGDITSLGVNRVVATNNACAHAEIIALTRAQHRIGHFTLRDPHQPDRRDFVLYTSAQMCAMCLGAVCWSGISEVIFGTNAEDTERLTGFDEGPIHPHWQQELQHRGIKVTGPVLQEQANQILADYKSQNQLIYAG